MEKKSNKIVKSKSLKIRKQLVFGSLFILLFSFSIYGQNASSRQIARPKGSTSCYFGYYEYLPSNYNSAAKLPLVIFFHGIGEAGNGTSDLSWVLRNGPPMMVQNSNKDFPFILISPQHNDGWWNTLGVDLMLQYVKKTYKVDTDRIYITGLSAGGYGTWVAGQGFANDLAAIVPISGCGDDTQAANMKNLPIWAFHNSGDPTVQVSCTTIMVDAVKKAGGNPKMTIYPNANYHDAWTATYNDQKMWDWLLAQKRNGSASTPPANQAPTANAGANITITLPTNSATISGAGSDSDGTISSYAWTQQSGPSSTLSNTNTATLSATKLLQGTYVFRLTVKDDDGATAYDETTLTVNAAASKNNPPVLADVADKTLEEGSTLQVNVSASDSDKDVIKLSVTGLPAFATFKDNANGTGAISFAPTTGAAGKYTLKITAADGNGGNDTSSFTLTVTAPSIPPVSSPPPSQQTVIYRVNCGGSQINDSPVNWETDTYSSPSKYTLASGYNTEGSCWWQNGTNTTGAPDCLFGSFRSSADARGIRYGFGVDDGQYIVNLFFAQKDNSFWAGTQKAGDHVFNILVEGQPSIKKFDMYAENGYNAVKKSITVTISDGVLNLDLIDVKGYPSINGIEIIAVTDAASSARIGDSFTPTLEFGQVLMYPNPINENNAVTLEFETPQKGSLNLSIIDQYGVNHFTHNRNLDQPTVKLNVDLSSANLKSGLYLMRINNGSKKAKVLKLIKK